MLSSCDRLSKGIITNNLNDTILIKLTANDVKEMKFNAGGKLFPSQYFDYFKDSCMINPKVDWKEPIFKGEFMMAPKMSFDFAVTMGIFGVPSIHFDTIEIKYNNTTLRFSGKDEIYRAFQSTDNRMYYLKIE